MSVKDQLKQNETLGRETKDAYSDMASDFAQLRKDFGALKNDFATLTSAGARDAKGALKDGIADAEEHTREAMEAATSEMQEMQELQKQAEKAVRKNPITAVAGALAIGYFLARLHK